jgi:multidrug efflux pump subunit AcrA (membrane-fusion protein)
MAILDIAKLLLVMVIVFICLGGALMGAAGLGDFGLGEKFEAELTKAEAELTQAQAEELRQQAEVTEARAELERAKAQSRALETQTDELVKHSQLNRRILAFYTARTALPSVLSVMNLLLWGAGLYLYWKQERA